MCIFASEMNRGISLIVLTCALGAFTVSCLEEPDCRENDTLFHLSFYSAADGTKLPVAFDSIWIKEQNDGFFHGKTLSDLDVPLALDGNTAYIEIVTGGTSYSVDLTYQTTPVLYSTECNVQVIISNHAIVNTTLDSISTSFNEIPARLNIYL